MRRIINRNIWMPFVLFGIMFLFMNCDKPENMIGIADINCGGNGSCSGSCAAGIVDMPLGELSLEEREGILLMREEEKLARDVYLEMYDQWGIQAFSNISRSEQRHMDAMLSLIERYDMEDPVASNDRGVFESEALQELYNTMIDDGSVDMISALKVGATIEEIDIQDLQNQINNIVDNEDMTMVYNNLLRASHNHLRAFTRNLQNRGVDYEPQYISQGELDEVLQSTNKGCH